MPLRPVVHCKSATLAQKIMQIFCKVCIIHVTSSDPRLKHTSLSSTWGIDCGIKTKEFAF